MTSLKNYIEVVFIATAIFFYNKPGHFNEILFAIYAAVLIDLVFRNLEKIPVLNKFKSYYENEYKQQRLKKKIDKMLEEEKTIEYQQLLIDNALSKAKSKEENKRKMGLMQLEQIGENDVCEELLKILNGTSDEIHRQQIIITLCRITKKSNHI